MHGANGIGKSVGMMTNAEKGKAIVAKKLLSHSKEEFGCAAMHMYSNDGKVD